MTAMTAAVQLFQENYPNVDIRLMAIGEAEYPKKLKEAAQNGNIPDIFEYADGGDTISVNTSAMQEIINSIHTEDYFGYDGQRSAGFIYTGYNIPLLYLTAPDVDTKIFSQANSDVFSWIQSEKYPIGMSLNSKEMYSQIFQMEIPTLESLTISDSAAELLVNGDITVYYSDTSEYALIQNKLAGKYSVQGLECDIVYCEPANRWSIAEGITKKENECAVRFLQFLLSEDGQECLYIKNQYPAIPVNQSVRDTYNALYTELADIIQNTHNRLK